MDKKYEEVVINNRKLDMYYKIEDFPEDINIFLIQDGQMLKDIENNIVDKLLSEYNNICLLFIHSEDRNKEYTPWKLSSNVHYLEDYKGGADEYLEEVMEEIIPFIGNRFKSGKINYYLVGSSLGGLVSTYGVLKYSSIFSGGVFISSSYWFIDFLDFIEKVELENKDLKIYMDVGDSEGSGKINYNTDIVEETKKVYNLLLDKNIEKTNISFIIQKNMHHDISFFIDRIYDGIKFILS